MEQKCVRHSGRVYKVAPDLDQRARSQRGTEKFECGGNFGKEDNQGKGERSYMLRNRQNGNKNPGLGRRSSGIENQNISTG